MLQDIVEKPIEMKDSFSTEAKSLLTGLLERNPVRRLGSGTDDAYEIKKHPWFSEIDWNMLYRRQIEPPFKPTVTGAEDTRNIDKMFTNEPPRDTPMINNGMGMNGNKQGEHFDQFTYVSPNE
jgi:serine/threonine protein kinase